MKEITNLWDEACERRVFEKNNQKFTLIKILDQTHGKSQVGRLMISIMALMLYATPFLNCTVQNLRECTTSDKKNISLNIVGVGKYFLAPLFFYPLKHNRG